MAGSEGVWAPARRALTVGIIASITLTALELLAVATAMPAVADELGRSWYGVAISAFSVASVAGVLLAGPAADRLGPARPYLAAGAAFAAGLLLAGFAPTMGVFIAGRSVQGLGAGAMAPVLYTAIGRGYPEATRLRMFSLVSTAWVLPGVAGPGLAGLVTDRFGWRWVFLGLVPVVVPAVAVTLVALRRVRPANEVAAAHPPIGAVVAFVAAAAVVLGGSGARSWPVALTLVTGGVVVASAASRRGGFVPPGTVVARQGVPAAVLSRFLLLYGFVAVDAFVPFAVTSVRGRSVLAGSLAVTAGTLTWTVGTWTAERLGKRHAGPVVVRVGFVVLALGVAIQLGYLVEGLPLALGLAGTAVAGFGTGLAYGLQSALVLAAAPVGAEGQASSAVSLADTLAFAAAPALTGALVALAEIRSWSLAFALLVAWLVALGACLVGAAAAVRISGSSPVAEPQPLAAA